jgi:hypothetical protein
MVAAHYFGMDIDEYSLKYILHHCENPEVMREALPKVQAVASMVIQGIESVTSPQQAREGEMRAVAEP